MPQPRALHLGACAPLALLALAGCDKEPPLPPIATVKGASRIVVLDRDAALMRLTLGEDDVTYLCQRARGIAPKYSDRTDGDLRAYAWRKGPFTCVAVGPIATADRWHAAFK